MRGAWCPRFARVLCAITWGLSSWGLSSWGLSTRSTQKLPRRSALRLSLSISRRQFRFDFDDANLPQRVVSKAAPLPLRRIAHQSPLYRIAMQVSQLDRKLACVPHIAIVIALLPERSRLKRAMAPQARIRFVGANLGDPAPHPLRKRKLQIMDRIRQRALFRFTQQQMDMLWHHNISIHAYRKQATHVFKSLNKEIVDVRSAKLPLPAVATERDKMGAPRLLEASESARHDESLPHPAPDVCDPHHALGTDNGGSNKR